MNNMPYLKKTYFAGKTIEVEKCYTNRYGKKGQKRRDKVKPTSEQQKEINKRNAEKMLRLLLNANFVGGDNHIILGYLRGDGEADRTEEEMRHGNYAKLASYLIKYTDKHRKKEDGALQKKRWSRSKNLKVPEPQIEVISERSTFQTKPKAIKGYYVDKDSVRCGIHSSEYYGYGIVRYILVKLE